MFYKSLPHYICKCRHCNMERCSYKAKGHHGNKVTLQERRERRRLEGQEMRSATASLGLEPDIRLKGMDVLTEIEIDLS